MLKKKQKKINFSFYSFCEVRVIHRIIKIFNILGKLFYILQIIMRYNLCYYYQLYYKIYIHVLVRQIYQKPGVNAYLTSIERAGHVWWPNRIFKKALEEKINGKRLRLRWADRVDDGLNKCAQRVTIADSLDRG